VSLMRVGEVAVLFNVKGFCVLKHCMKCSNGKRNWVKLLLGDLSFRGRGVTQIRGFRLAVLLNFVRCRLI
jgi:hypothetical protein